MLRFGMFKTRKPREFNLRPRYYDERKERLEKLRLKHSDEAPKEFNRKLYREHLQENWSARMPQRQNGGQLLRMLIIIFLLITVIYFVFDIDFIESINGK